MINGKKGQAGMSWCVWGVGWLMVMGCAHAPSPKPPPAEEEIGHFLQAAVQEISTKLGQAQYPLAVMSGRDVTGKQRPLDRHLAAALVHGFVQRGVPLVERAALAAVIKEQKLSSSQLISDQTAVSIGQLAGARALVLTQYSLQAAQVLVNLRVIDSERGHILATAKCAIPRRVLAAPLLALDRNLPSAPVVTMQLYVERERGGVPILVENGSALASYNRYKIRLTCDRPLHLYLIAIDADANVSLVFPGALTGLANPVGSGTHMLPAEAWFILDEHVGREAMLLIGSKGPLSNVEQLLALTKASLTGAPTEANLKRVSSVLAPKVDVIRAVHYLHR